MHNFSLVKCEQIVHAVHRFSKEQHGNNAPDQENKEHQAETDEDSLFHEISLLFFIIIRIFEINFIPNVSLYLPDRFRSGILDTPVFIGRPVQAGNISRWLRSSQIGIVFNERWTNVHFFGIIDKNGRAEEGSARGVILICGEGKRQFSVQLITVSRNDISGVRKACASAVYKAPPPYLFIKVIFPFRKKKAPMMEATRIRAVIMKTRLCIRF